MTVDSKVIFRNYQKNLHLCNWLNEDQQLAKGEEDVFWQYCGVDDDFRNELVKQVIESFFREEEFLYLCVSATKTVLINKELIVNQLSKLLPKKEIGLTDESFGKIIYFTSYGVFKKGINQQFDKNRERVENQSLKVSFFTNVIEERTKNIPDCINESLRIIEKELEKNYGGTIEHLWIDIELVEKYDIYPFRFQKRVSSPASYTEPYTYNVGHFSIKPDFKVLEDLDSSALICSYFLDLLYEGTSILLRKQKDLGGFDAISFQSDFLKVCKKIKGIIS